MPDTPIAANLNQAFDIEVNLLAQLTLNIIPPLDNLPDAVNLILSQFAYLGCWVNTSLG
jgi:hypothetical protein